MLARSDEEITLEAIAREAGVGIGTLYRHFPTREALVVEAYGDEIDHLCTAASGLLGTLPPAVALREWVQWLVDYVASKRGMAAALGAAVDGDPALSDTHDQLVGALEALCEAGWQAGTLRRDVDAHDVLFALRGIWMVPPAEPRDRPRRLLNLLVDGLSTGDPGSGSPAGSSVPYWGPRT